MDIIGEMGKDADVTLWGLDEQTRKENRGRPQVLSPSEGYVCFFFNFSLCNLSAFSKFSARNTDSKIYYN